MFDFVGWSGCRTGRSTVPDVTESSSIHVRDWMMSRWTTTPNNISPLSRPMCVTTYNVTYNRNTHSRY